MTQEEAKSLWPVIQAFAEGKAIQFTPKASPGIWKDCVADDFNFDNDAVIWRVKPEPREFWIIKIKDDPAGRWTVYSREPKPAGPAAVDAYEVVHLREVME